MSSLHLTKGSRLPEGFFDGAVARIRQLQRADGSIPWYDGGVFDPWNHIEAAMGLDVLGHRDEALAAYKHLQDTQLDDGSWWMQMGSAVPLDEDEQRFTGSEEEAGKPVRDTNSAAYIATGVWHRYLLTHDLDFLKAFWPHVKAAIDFVLRHQTEHGEIRWTAADTDEPDDALITSCCSIHKSLEHAALIADELGETKLATEWLAARAALGEAVRSKPHRFNRTWEPKDNFSMEWYYPVLGGVLTGEAARAQIAKRWDEFIHDGQGCRCVVDQPWVTIAESCELTLALIAAGMRKRAEQLLSWQHQYRCDEGAYWMGYHVESQAHWPAERPAWTAGAVILATDAVTHLTAAADILTGSTLPQGLDAGIETLKQRQRVHKR